MKKVSNFEVLEKLSQENNQNFHMYLENNIESANSGKKYGSVKINISNNDVYDIMIGNKNRRFMLLTFLDDDYQRIKSELEMEE
jgi:hypothetical protein